MPTSASGAASHASVADDLEAEVAEEVAWLEGAYGDDVLERLVASNGHDS